MTFGAAAVATGLTLAMMAAAPAEAQSLSIDLPAGSVRDQVTTLGRLGGISVVVMAPASGRSQCRACAGG